MPGRGPQTFKKRQKEQQRKERQEEKMAKRLARKDQPPTSSDDIDLLTEPVIHPSTAPESEQRSAAAATPGIAP